MKYYSTNKQAPVASLEEAVVKGLAGDKGLYMPEYIDSLDEEVIANMKNQSFHEIACTVAQMFFGEDIEPKVLDGIVKDTLSFETPVVPVKDNIYSLELFHGPTLAFKDVGGRFMTRLFHKERGIETSKRIGSYFRRYGKRRRQRIPRRSGHSRVCALSQGKGQPDTGMPVHDIRTEHHGIGDRRHVRRLPSAG